MKKIIWQPLVLGVLLGVLAGISTITNLSFLTAGISQNTIGLYMTLFLIAAALGGPLAGALAPLLWMIISAVFGPPEVKMLITIPATFWSNLLALVPALALVGLTYRMIFEHLRMPERLLAWAVIIVILYSISLPVSLISQNLLLGDPRSEILPTIFYSYETYIPQAIFDIFFTSLVFIALPAALSHPLWYESQKALERNR